MSEPIIEVSDLRVDFPSEEGTVHAIRGVHFDLFPHEVFGIVGESGSGKSVTSLALIGLLAKSATASGSIKLNGEELLGKSEKELTPYRGKTISMIFQDPMTSLNPVYTIGWQIMEAIQAHREISKEDAKKEAVRLLEAAGISQAENRMESYPHEFSGGMRQRAVIAIAMANSPQVILADEPTTALDVTVQAQVLDTLRVALRETQASLVLITHDLGVIAGLADRVAVMYAGRIVETGTVEDLFYRTAMPYTHGLLGSIPSVDDTGMDRLRQIPGAPPTMVGDVKGCPFAPRCPLRQATCLEIEPELVKVTNSESSSFHASACHFANDVTLMPVASMFTDTSSADESERTT